ncbi:unnamed protein product [Dibothriocephalus latus]|uniref:Uncharacterized protein n=1 Tax=Dibothriocephalus latus TaxID=60516 RepID=A0A3P7M4Y4_DIBLA|nr:unnamed protein product [Dibothriocephalus latus]
MTIRQFIAKRYRLSHSVEMKACVLILFALVAVAFAEDNDEKSVENLRVNVIQNIASIQKFFKKDPLARQRIHKYLAKYLKNLKA